MPQRLGRPTVLFLATLLAACSSSGGGTASAPAPVTPSVAAPIASASGPVPAGRIAFGRFDAALGDFAIFTMLADGSDLRPLLAGAHEGPKWSPGDATISVTSMEDGNMVRILRPDGSLVRVLKRPDATIGLGCSTWSPDGTRFICEGWDDVHPDRVGLYTVRTSDGGDLRRLTSPADGMHDLAADFSPDGTRVAYVHVTSEQRETGQIWTMNADGSNAHRASDLDVGWGLQWSPDGRWLLADSDGGLVVFDGTNLSAAPRRITMAGLAQGLPAFGASWSPDGTHLVFSIVRAGMKTPDIATIAADGTDLHILTSDPAKEELPDWGLPH